MGCKAPRVGHCEAAHRRISQDTRRPVAIPPEPEAALKCQMGHAYFGSSLCLSAGLGGQIFYTWEE